MPLRLLPLVALASLLASASAHAAPVTYTLSGIFSGSLSTSSFTDVPGTITFVGDTKGTTLLSTGYFIDTTGVSTIKVGTLVDATILNTSFGAYGGPMKAGFFDSSTGFGVNVYDPTLADYNLAAPFSDAGLLQTSIAAQDGVLEYTSQGVLRLSGDLGSPATFTAVSTTPEPASFVLLGSGALGAFGTILRRAKARRAATLS